MRVEDQYPSTADYVPIAGGQDVTLAILIGARQRYARGASQSTYINHGMVCAIGAVAAEAGLGDGDTCGLGEEWEFDQWREVMRNADIEKSLRKGARKAIKLLNKAAIELHPDLTHDERWSGPLEHVNQALPFKSARIAVLNCYDLAIKRRSERSKS